MKSHYRIYLFFIFFGISTAANAQTWKYQPSMQVKRSEAAAVEYKGELYVFNGFSKGLSIGNSIEKYNPNNKQWKIIGTTSIANGTAVSHTGTVLVDNEVWLIGGRIGSHPGKVTQNVWIYNLDSLKWRKGPKLPKPMAGGGSALVGNKIYTFGGMDAKAQCDVNFHYVYDLKKPASGWQDKTAAAAMPSARNHFSTVVFNNSIYAIGGQHGHDGCPKKRGGNVALVHSYSPLTNKWTRLANLPAIESHNEPSTFVHNGFIYTVGGATAGNKVLRFDPSKNKWQHIVNLPEPLLAPVARIYNGTLMVAGGGAPITAKSKVQARFITLAKFNDVASTAANAADVSNSVTNNISTASGVNTSMTTNKNTGTDNLQREVNGMVIIEAEKFTSKTGGGPHQWIDSNYAQASGGKSMIASPNKGKLATNTSGSPKLAYSVNFSAAGTYYVWIRGWGDENTRGIGSNDSVHAGLNSLISPTADKIDGFAKGWHWSNRTRDGVPAKISVPSAGEHTFNLWMREDGFAIDKIVLARKASYDPTGTTVVEVEQNTNTESADTSNANTGTASANNANTDNTSADNSNTDSTSTSHTSNDTTSAISSDTGNASNNQTDNAAIVLTVEAEDYLIRSGTSKHQWVKAKLSDASANGSMITTPNSSSLKANEKNAPMMSYLLRFPEPGKYYMWIRGWGDEASNGVGGNDSINAGLNGKLSPTADKIDGFPKGWHWSRRTRDGVLASLTVPSAGTHSVNLWMREDGFAVDKFILTKDISYKPAGTDVAGVTIATTNNNTGTNTNVQSHAADNVQNNQPTQHSGSFVAPGVRAWELVQTVNGSAVAARHEAGAVVVDDVLYMMGGRGNRPVQSYSQSENKWTSHGKAPVLMHHFQPVAIGSKIYVIGAMKDDKFPNEKPLEHVYIFNTDNHKWNKSTAIPVSRRRGSVGAAVYKGKIYLVGGNTVGHAGTAVNWFDEYNPVSKQWRRMPNAPKARDHITIAIVDDKLVVAGGRRSKHPNVVGDTEASTDVFNFTKGSWEATAANIPTQRAGAMVVAVGNEVVVIGGESRSKASAHTDVEALNVKTGKWRKLQPLLVGRHSGGAALLGSKVQVISGFASRGGGNESISHETLLLNLK